MTTATTEGAAQGGLSEYDTMLKELETFSKALKADDEGEGEGEGDKGDARIEDAAAAAGDSTTGGDGDGDGEDGEDGEGEPFGKSFRITLADGSEQEAFDGTAMLKSLILRNDQLQTRTVAAEGALARQLEVNTALMTNLGEMGSMLKALRADVRKFGATGTGRRSLVNVLDKQPVAAAPARPEGLKPSELMAKALAFQLEGKMTGLDVARLESHVVGRGLPVPADLAPLFAS